MLLAVLMVLTTGIAAVLPAVAADGGNEARIGEAEYATLEAAIKEAKDGDTITLLRDLSMTINSKAYYYIYKDITIDGGDAMHKITASGGYTFQFCDSFTLKNLKLDTQAGFRFWNTSRKATLSPSMRMRCTISNSTIFLEVPGYFTSRSTSLISFISSCSISLIFLLSHKGKKISSHAQVRFTMKILISYNTHIGNATKSNVKMSEVGVMTAAMIRMMTIACRR